MPAREGLSAREAKVTVIVVMILVAIGIRVLILEIRRIGLLRG